MVPSSSAGAEYQLLEISLKGGSELFSSVASPLVVNLSPTEVSLDVPSYNPRTDVDPSECSEVRAEVYSAGEELLEVDGVKAEVGWGRRKSECAGRLVKRRECIGVDAEEEDTPSSSSCADETLLRAARDLLHGVDVCGG